MAPAGGRVDTMMWPPDDVNGNVRGLVEKARSVSNRMPDTQPLTKREEAAVLARLQNASADAQPEGDDGLSSDEDSHDCSRAGALPGQSLRPRKSVVVDCYYQTAAGCRTCESDDDSDG
eukprot:2717567-Rhodomonas_salina.1